MTSTEEVYEVEGILADKMEEGERKFLVRWKGYSPADDTWEPLSGVNHLPLWREYEDNRMRCEIGLFLYPLLIFPHYILSHFNQKQMNHRTRITMTIRVITIHPRNPTNKEREEIGKRRNGHKGHPKRN